jgi:hypothetical protein
MDREVAPLIDGSLMAVRSDLDHVAQADEMIDRT